MSTFEQLQRTFRLADAADIALVSLFLYTFFMWFKNIVIEAQRGAGQLPRCHRITNGTIGRDAGEVKLEASLIDDLGAESIDFVDIIFRLQRQFKVKIPRGKIVEEARGSLGAIPGQRAAPSGLCLTTPHWQANAEGPGSCVTLSIHTYV